MGTERSIFGLRFDSDASLNPTEEELSVFLESPKRLGGRDLHRDDLTRYSRLLESLRAFERRELPDSVLQDIREKMFYAVLGHSHFVAPGLKLAVEQFKYHLHELASLDPAKPAAFIRIAKAEMKGLNAKKKEEAKRLTRLHVMVEERKRSLAILARRRPALVEELNSIAGYVRENLVRIERLCKAALAILADPHILQQEEKELINDVKEQMREELKDSLHARGLSRDDLEAAKRDMSVLANEISSLRREDVGAMVRLYEAVHDHVRAHIAQIDRLLAGRRRDQDWSPEDDKALFSQLERILVSLVSNYRFEFRAPELRSETAHDHVLRDVRRGLHDSLSRLLERDRRVRKERRSGTDRRRIGWSHIQASERRKGVDRRSGKNRRVEIL